MTVVYLATSTYKVGNAFRISQCNHSCVLQVTDLLRQYFTDTFIQSDLQASNTHTHQEQPCALQPLAPGHFNT